MYDVSWQYVTVFVLDFGIIFKRVVFVINFDILFQRAVFVQNFGGIIFQSVLPFIPTPFSYFIKGYSQLGGDWHPQSSAFDVII